MSAAQLVSESSEEIRLALVCADTIDLNQITRRELETINGHLRRANAKMMKAEMILAGFQMPRMGE